MTRSLRFLAPLAIVALIMAACSSNNGGGGGTSYVAGGPQNALNTNFGNGGDCLFADPAECYLHHQASFITGFFEDNFPDAAVAGDTYDFFPMPAIDFSAVETAGDLFGMFNDTPQARSLMAYLVTPEAQAIWVGIGGAISPNSEVPVSDYPDETSQRFAQILQDAEVVRFDASDKMPDEMSAAFNSAILDYVGNPGNLDSILGDLESTRQSAYGDIGQSDCQQAGPPPSEDNLGGSISILATWADAEQDAFLEMIQPWVDRTGVDVQYESTRDLNAVLTTRVEGGNPPDVAGLPGPGQMAQFARAGSLYCLDEVLPVDQMQQQYNEGWIADGTVDDQLVGIFIKVAVKGLIWYNPQAFDAAGYEVPSDWDGLNSLVEKIHDDGTPPWGIGLESGAASGWPGTDWIEDFVLRQSGPEVYDAWWQGTQEWTSDEIKKAFEAFGKWAANAGS